MKDLIRIDLVTLISAELYMLTALVHRMTSLRGLPHIIS